MEIIKDTVLGRELYGFRGEGDKPFFLILPGGAYAACADGEGLPVAEYFASLGYSAYVLRYTTLYRSFPIEKGDKMVCEKSFDTAIGEVAAAVSCIRAGLDRFGSNGKCIVCGFSAGGHLAASYGNMWSSLGEENKVKPDIQLLCYAVTKLKSGPSIMMNRAVLGKKDAPSDEEIKEFSPVCNVKATTPPTFLWHTVTDESVPVEQTLNMASALKAGGVPFEVHIYSEGPHASALADGLPAESWKHEAVRFINRILG